MTKSTSGLPTGYRKVTPYLVVQGVPRLLDFLQSAFHAEETVSAEEPNGPVTHAAVKLGDCMLEMGDVGGTERQPLLAGLHFYVPEVDSTYNSAIHAGANSLYPPKQTDYGERQCGIEDPVGNQWYIATYTVGPHYRPDPLQDLNSYLSVKDATPLPPVRPIRFQRKNSTETRRQLRPDRSRQISDRRHRSRTLRIPWPVGSAPSRPPLLHADCDDVFAQVLRAGARLYFPMKDQVYGVRAGGLIYNWGNHWYIATHLEDPSMGETHRRASAEASESAS